MIVPKPKMIVENYEPMIGTSQYQAEFARHTLLAMDHLDTLLGHSCIRHMGRVHKLNF